MDLHFSLPRMGSTSKLGQARGSDRLWAEETKEEEKDLTTF